MASPVAPPAAPPPVDSGLIEHLEARYKARLKAAIEAHKRYPRRARRLGQQGQIIVRFVVDHNGVINAVEVVQSSGFKRLDQAAIETIRSISGQLPFPEEIPRKHWTFRIPITYRLR